MSLILGRAKGRRTLDKVEGFSTCVGVDSTFHGAINGPGNVIIHGKVEGDCDLEGTLIIGESGTWVGNICAETVIIAGKVEGDVMARDKMDIVSTAHIKGRIVSAVIAIAEGAIHEGQIQMTSSKDVTRYSNQRDANSTPVEQPDKKVSNA